MKLQRLINRVLFNRDVQRRPYVILQQLEGIRERYPWDYCSTPAEAIKALLWWQQALTANGYTICQADTFWVVFHVPKMVMLHVAQANTVHDDPYFVPLPDAEVQPPFHTGIAPRHMILSIVNTTVGATPSLKDFVSDARNASRVWYGVN